MKNFLPQTQHKGNAPKKRWKYLLMGVALLSLASGAYLLWLALAQPVYMPVKGVWNKPVPRTVLKEQRMYIPRLSLNLLYDSNQHILNDGLWHRHPDRGNPERGGNFILAGHRFEIGFSPGETQRKSPLYHIDKIQQNDSLYADFNGKRYKYVVTHKYNVKPSQIEIEAPSVEAKMTLYTCTLKGEADGREVLEARLVEKNVDPGIELR